MPAFSPAAVRSQSRSVISGEVQRDQAFQLVCLRLLDALERAGVGGLTFRQLEQLMKPAVYDLASVVRHLAKLGSVRHDCVNGAAVVRLPTLFEAVA